MTANSVGYLTGSLLCGVLFDSYNKLLLLFVAVFGNAVTAAIIPWCFVYEIMVIMHIAKGTFCGALDASTNFLHFFQLNIYVHDIYLVSEFVEGLVFYVNFQLHIRVLIYGKGVRFSMIF